MCEYRIISVHNININIIIYTYIHTYINKRRIKSTGKRAAIFYHRKSTETLSIVEAFNKTVHVNFQQRFLIGC